MSFHTFLVERHFWMSILGCYGGKKLIFPLICIFGGKKLNEKTFFSWECVKWRTWLFYINRSTCHEGFHTHWTSDRLPKFPCGFGYNTYSLRGTFPLNNIACSILVTVCCWLRDYGTFLNSIAQSYCIYFLGVRRAFIQSGSEEYRAFWQLNFY